MPFNMLKGGILAFCLHVSVATMLLKEPLPSSSTPGPIHVNLISLPEKEQALFPKKEEAPPSTSPKQKVKKKKPSSKRNFQKQALETSLPKEQQKPSEPPSIPSAPHPLKALYAPRPTYPLVARKRHDEGTVVVSLIINPSGEVEAVHLVTSSGKEILDQHALQTIKGWRYTPPHKTVTHKISVVFSLTKGTEIW